MALLIIQQDTTTAKARDWLAGLIDDVLDRLDMEKCVGLVNGDAIVQEIIGQIGYLTPRDIDWLFSGAVESLLE